MTTTDEFTAFNYAKLTTADLDLGSGGILMLPDQQGDDPHILVQAGKEGRIIVLNRDNLAATLQEAHPTRMPLQDIPARSRVCGAPRPTGTGMSISGPRQMWPRRSN